MKRILNALSFHLAVRLGPWLIRLLGRTWRIRWVGEEHYDACRADGGNVIHAFWHGRLLALTFSHRNRAIQILISRHRDGEIIRRITGSLGFGSVRGSTGKGGARAILQMVKKGRAGFDLAITPDGPKGPREKAQGGLLLIAQRSGLPILPLSAASSKGRILNSWDRFRIPAPFSRVIIGYGPPIRVPADIPPEEGPLYLERVEKALSDLETKMDRMTRETD